MSLKTWKPWFARNALLRAAGTSGTAAPETKPSPFDRHLWLRALGFFRPYKWLAALIALAIVAVSGLNLLPPLLIKGLIDHAIPAGQQLGSARPLVPYVLGLVVVPLASGLIGLAQQYLGSRMGQGVLADLRLRLFTHLQGQSLRYFTTTRTGEIAARVSDDVNAVKSSVTDTLEDVLSNLLTVIGTLTVLFFVSWPLALVACVALPIFMLPARRIGRYRKELVTRTQERQAELMALLQDVLNVGGFLLMRMFGRQGYEAGRFDGHSQELRRLRTRAVLAGQWFWVTVRVLGSIGPAGVFFYGGWLVIRGEVSVGTVVAFVTYLTTLYFPMTRLAGVYASLQEASGVFGRIFATLDLAPDVADRLGAVELNRVRGEVRFDNVTFRYREDQRPALANVSFTAKPGQLVALVGPSGAGKTTVTYLAPRFHDPSEGTVLIDQTDVRDATLSSLAAQVGMVTQDTYLFHTTVRENLLYAKPDATPAEMEAVCRAAHIHDFIRTLPDGYETVVGERGVKLSGGERQRLAIARVLLKDPRILILDEATSALDSTSERLIQEALAPLMKGRTTLAIAHRLSTVLAADRILVLDEGRLVEQGTHPELLAKGGLYARLYREQFERAGPHPAVQKRK